MTEMIYTDCVNCGAGIVAADEPNCCMICGRPLCEQCYDDSPYCRDCSEKQAGRSGECVECGRECLSLSEAGVCEGCVQTAIIDAMEMQ